MEREILKKKKVVKKRESLKGPKPQVKKKVPSTTPPPTPTPTYTPPPPPQKSKGTSKGLVGLVAFVAFLCIGIAGYIIYTDFFVKPPEEVAVVKDDDSKPEVVVEDEEEEEEEVVEDTDTEFEGEVLSATLPVGWTIIEYFDGDGTESLPDMTEYFGLTAFDIVNPDSEQVFTVQAVSGIGFAGCPEYALFDDNGEAYMAEQESASNDMGEVLNVVDYTDEDYEEFEFLNTTFRRIGKKYFYDTQEGNNYFEPPCVDGLFTLEGLYFEDEDGYTYEAYFYGATEVSTEIDLLVVDVILESMGVVD
ncbi:hypothetical protein K8R14_00250 [bacterium]|nr:hypothetical protein [bacterium]